MSELNAPLTIGLDHVGLTVADISPTRRFFCDCLGWKVVGEQPSYPAVFVSDGTTIVTIWQAKSGSACTDFDRHQNTGLHHLALRVKDIKTLELAYEKAKAFQGVKIEFAPEPLGATSITHFMAYEPGGCRIEFDCRPH